MGNPCIKENENEYRMRVVAYLPKLKYIDYSVIEKEFRTQALEKHREEINDQETRE